MKSELEQKIVVVYTGDETKARKKLSGQTIVEQMFKSVNSIRQNWSINIEVIFIHTEPLSQQTLCKLAKLKVTPLLANRKISAEFPIANKFLVGEVYQGSKDILFLDCDTIVHQPLSFELSADLLVAFDALQDVSEECYRRLYKTLGVKFPTGDFTKKPSYEYYYNDQEDLFPLINTGVYCIKNKYKDIFYKRLEENFQKTYELFKSEMAFYFDQICFVLTMLQLCLNYQYLPKGYNFICTPRAPYLKDWPKDRIFIEHYAGNNSRPLIFNGNKIDLIKSGII